MLSESYNYLQAVPIQTTIEESCRNSDTFNADIEELNGVYSVTREEGSVDEHGYYLYKYKPRVSRLWHYKDDLGRPASKAYPKILFVHGVASDHRYFSIIKNDLVRLGIEVALLDLPVSNKLANNYEGLMELHIKAVEDAYDNCTKDGSIVTLAGHSRGSLVTTLAVSSIVAKAELATPAGIIAMSPAGYDAMKMRQIIFGVLKLGGLAVNVLKHQDKIRGLELGIMVVSNALKKPMQTYTESRQALSMSVSDCFESNLKDIPCIVLTGTNDQFIDHNAIVRFARHLPNSNLSIVTHDVDHMLDIHNSTEIISLADIRTLSGQILSWLQSQMPEYSPWVYKAGEPTKRL